jgi:glucose/arabinose dehydrogenase
MRILLFIGFLIAAQAATPSCQPTNLLKNSNVPDPNYCPFIWATGLSLPRGVAIATNNDLLTVEQGLGQVTVLWDADNDGSSGNGERAVLAQQAGLNHGIAIDVVNGMLYASNQTDVFRWPYMAGQRSSLGASQHVITNLPCCHHVTRSLQISSDRYLYVQSGSGSNVDPDPSHSQIRRVLISSLSSTPYDWNAMQLVASGLRNEVGIRFDSDGNLWGVENGVDDLDDSEFGGDIHQDNPCEELNLFKTASNQTGYFYGYPYCWSEGILQGGKGPGTQWLMPGFGAPYSDSWCQSTQNVVPPQFCFLAHNAPMDIIFGNLTAVNGVRSAYVSFHGSWDRDIPSGYMVRQVVWSSSGTVTATDILKYDSPNAYGPGWIRPVGLGWINTMFGVSLMITSDATNQIIGLAYQ